MSQEFLDPAVRDREEIGSAGHLAEQVRGDLPVSGVSVTAERLF